ncbi:MAG: DNA primase [Sutterellaceae bacterium]|nr:DNA primase [Sutterellaceae bacterium]
MIPQSFIQELLSRVDIVEIVNKVSPLKKTGKNYMCCCPFHKEKTPSFSVSGQKQFYKCFGCGVSGNAIGFVMAYEGLNYVEAITKLADSVGMTVPQDPQAKERSAKAKTLTDLMAEASHFYSESLKGNTRVVDYLKTRGISGETAAKFGLGYSPDAWHALKDVFGEQYESPELEEVGGCGLVIKNDEGRRYDRFRGRLMFPIRNPRGQVIGFGARTLNGDEHPKYLNSPETAIYHKGLEIYGLYEGSQAMRQNNRAIICEGYMDVIQLSQAGFAESCAALGTAVTADHVRKLLRLVNKIYFSFDGDSAGQHALRRAMEAALPAVSDEQEVRFVVLPPEHDPDSLIKERGAAAFEAELEKSLTLTQFFVKTVGAEKDFSTAEGRSRFLAEAKPLVVSMTSAPFLRTQLVAELAMHARMSPDELERAFGIVRPVPTTSRGVMNTGSRLGFDSRRGAKKAPRRIAPVSVGSLRERLLQNLLNYPQLAVEFDARFDEEFVGAADTLSQEIVEVWRTILSAEEPIMQTNVLSAALRESEHYGHYQVLIGQEMEIQTTLEIAQAETELTFDRLEYMRLDALLTEVVSSPKLDMDLIRRLNARRKVAKDRIEAEQRRQVDLAADHDMRN